MISPLNDLETRRKILFMDGPITIRNLAADSILITLGPASASRAQMEKIKTFLAFHFRSRKMSTIIIDVSQANCLMLLDILAFAKLPVTEFKGLAFLISNRLMEIVIRLLTLRRKSSYHVKIFKTFNLALTWSRTLK